jgi:hypothetical protein
MSLTKPPLITPEKLAANQANARQSHGPATWEGRERIRDSHVRHGAYAHAPGEALRALGEDPEDFNRLLQSLQAEWQPVGELQSRLVQRLARALWRLERNDRVQESMAVRRVWAAKAKVDQIVGEACRPLEQAVGDLEALAQAVAVEDYVTGDEEIDLFFEAYGEPPPEKAQNLLALLTRLREPGQEVAKPEDPDEGWALPQVPAAEGEERTSVWNELQTLLQEELDDRRAALDREFESRMRGTLPYYRDSAIAPDSPRASGVYRTEDSAFRQMMRLTDLLLKLKGGVREAPKKIKNEGISHDVDENKGSILGSHDVNENK